MAKCGSVNPDIEKGSFCFNGELDGFALAKDPLTVSIASLITPAWWNSQVYDASNRVTTLIGKNYAEMIAGELEIETPDSGFDVQTSKKSNKYVLKYQSTECLRKSGDDMNGRTFYALFFTKGQFIQGIPYLSVNMKFVKTNVAVSYETINKVTYIVFTFTFEDDFETLYAEEEMEDGFRTADIPTLTGITLESETNVVAELVVKAYACNRAVLEGLDDSKFTFYDVTAGAAVTPDSTTIVGNVITADFTLSPNTLGNIIKTSYTGPEADNLYVINKEVSSAVTA